MAVAAVRGELLYAWKGSSLLVTNPRGDCGDDQPLAGFYFLEARFLSTLRVEVNGHAPWLCESAMTRPDALEFTYVYPEITAPGGGGTGQSGDEEGTDADGLAERSLDLLLSYGVGVASLDAVLVVTNRARRVLTFEIGCALGADFADIQEAQAARREQNADVVTSGRERVVAFSYGHPELRYRSEVHFSDGWTLEAGGEGTGDGGPSRRAASLTLAPQESKTLSLRVVPVVGGQRLSEAECRDRAAALERWQSAFTRVTVPGNRLFERVVHDNIRDFGSFPMLHGDRDEWLALQAGMPMYPAFFGRDAVTAGWQAALVDRGDALEAGLTKLTRLQSNRIDDWRDEQPGRVPYQVRSGPLALLNINPYAAYYADHASPLMFVIALANLYVWTGDRNHLDRHWDTARRILDWARDYGDADGDGYLEYQTRSSKGTKNQGWKDSGDAIVYDDGAPVPAPIATCEVQGYWYQAQALMALLCAVRGDAATALAYRAAASSLKDRFNRDWWVEQEGFFALALDPGKQRVRAVTSNVGHCMAAGIVEAGRLPQVVGRMFAPDLFSGWGIRTLSSRHAFYNPLSYHRGTVWAVEQGTIVFGLRRFGFVARALELTRAMFDLSLLYAEHRIPECVGGYARGERPTPGAYPRANTPQLWNASAFPLALQSMLGVLPLAPVETLIIDPVLPTWMPEVVLHGLRVGAATVSLHFWRDSDGASKWEVLHKRGTLHVVRQPPPESLTAGLGDRVSGALETMIG